MACDACARGVAQREHGEWDVSLHNASEMLDASFGDDIYNTLLQRNLSSLLPVVYGFVQTVTPVLSGVHLAKAKAYFEAQSVPDLVVSFVPFSNAAMCDALPSTTPVITVFTDFAHSAAHPWLQHPRQIVCCGTERSHRQALEFGIPPERAIRTSGMIVHPDFYEFSSQPGKSDIKLVSRSGQHPEALHILVLFGGFPPTALVKDILQALQTRATLCVDGVADEVVTGYGWREPVAVTVVCGRNEALFADLSAEPCRTDTRIVGYTESVAELMRNCDLIVGKPGPGVVSEALVSGKPLILFVGEQPSYTMEQEGDVLAFVRSVGIGKVVRTVTELVSFSSTEIAFLRKNVLELPPNRALYEVIKVIENQMLARVANPV